MTTFDARVFRRSVFCRGTRTYEDATASDLAGPRHVARRERAASSAAPARTSSTSARIRHASGGIICLGGKDR